FWAVRIFGSAARTAVLGWRDADLIQEKAREVALRREAELRGDLGNLAFAGGQTRNGGLDAQHVEVGTRREPGAQLEQVVEARTRQADAVRQLVHAELLVRPRAQQRDRLPDAAVLETRAAPQVRRGAPLGEVGLDDQEHQLLQHEFQALGGQEPVVQHLDREGLGEPSDARRDLLAQQRERSRVLRPEHRRKAGMQPAPRSVEHERARGFVVDVDLAGIEEQQLAVLLLQYDDRVGQRLEDLAWRELHQH